MVSPTGFRLEISAEPLTSVNAPPVVSISKEIKAYRKKFMVGSPHRAISSVRVLPLV